MFRKKRIGRRTSDRLLTCQTSRGARCPERTWGRRGIEGEVRGQKADEIAGEGKQQCFERLSQVRGAEKKRGEVW